jgi:hypothetical protein
MAPIVLSGRPTGDASDVIAGVFFVAAVLAGIACVVGFVASLYF